MTVRRHRPLPLALAALALGAAALTTGCAPIVVGGAMVGGTMMAVDRRTSGTQIEDQSIEVKAGSRARELLGDRGHVNVTSWNRTALLTGEVPSEADKAAVEQAVSKVENVQAIVNELAVMPPTSFSNRTNDTYLTSRVKAALVDVKEISAIHYKVVTERSVVYLMGKVTEREANIGTEVARNISGVQKVVRLFEIASEAEIANLTQKK